MNTPNRLIPALALACALLAGSAAAAEPENQSDRFFRECRAAWADNNIGLADELCYKALTHPDANAISTDAKSQRLYNYAQLKRMLGNWDGAEELLRESLAIEEKRAGDTPDLPLARRLAELSIALAAQNKWSEGVQTIERLVPMADRFKGGERAAVAELFRNYVPQVAVAGKLELARQLEQYSQSAPASEPGFIQR
ncbi:MAG TPA: tetratricopeptide repeat protein [Methyloversatilis sp.]